MNYTEALELVEREGIDFEGMVTEARGGKDPERDRVRRLIVAIQIIHATIRGDSQLDRQLAHALFCLTVQLGTLLAARKQCDWSDDYFEMTEVIESVFDKTWA